jgi:hypothetical protein
MTTVMSQQILIAESGDEIPSPELIADETHCLSVEVSTDNHRNGQVVPSPFK